jgi:acyl carrier protein
LEEEIMLERVAKVLREYKGVEDLEVTLDTTLEELELDSLDTVELVMNLEEEFGISIELEQGVKSVGDIVTLIEKNI